LLFQFLVQRKRARRKNKSNREGTFMKRYFLIASMLFGALACATSAWAQQAGKVQVLWLGQSAFKITTPTGKVIVTHYGAEPNGFIIKLENGLRIYHMDDTGIFGDMKWIGEYYKPDLLLISIGGNFTMDPVDAAYATRELIKPKYAIPMHYGSNPLEKGTPREYVDALGGAGVKVLGLASGEKGEF
jgi:L-ascorbate metabolism protein UlaG (beta-lactamase superfamily)